MKKIILAIVCIIAIIFVIGSVGAFERNNISLFQCLIQCAIGIGVEWLILSQAAK